MGMGPVKVVRAGGAGEQWSRLLRALCSGVLLLALLTASGCSRLDRVQSHGSGAVPLAAGGPAGRLQEVAPPAAVQQLRQALDQHRPQLTITAPADGTLLPAGSWTLRVSGSDWPLTDAGDLGLGAHLAVQVDDGPPLRLTGDSAAAERFELAVPMAPLAPGSHRITLTAVRPWGEVVKSPGASAQIRLHRVAANPLSLPAPGTPQLIVASPAELSGAEPVLLDWLLQDAPLQGLREGDARWRLRVTINGDSFLVDQNTPLWLKGWRLGSNSLLMELVDARGEPINPPFNSLVREVTLEAAGPRPRWLGGALSEEELGVLLGTMPAPEPKPTSPTAPSTSSALEEPAALDEQKGEDPVQTEPSAPPNEQASAGGAAKAEAPAEAPTGGPSTALADGTPAEAGTQEGALSVETAEGLGQTSTGSEMSGLQEPAE
jgi:hypothetical protein